MTGQSQTLTSIIISIHGKPSSIFSDLWSSNILVFTYGFSPRQRSCDYKHITLNTLNRRSSSQFINFWYISLYFSLSLSFSLHIYMSVSNMSYIESAQWLNRAIFIHSGVGINKNYILHNFKFHVYIYIYIYVYIYILIIIIIITIIKIGK